jgi:hypothetical protein
VPIIEKDGESEGLERLCHGVSHGDVCNYPATVHCHAHAEDERWHSCMQPPTADVDGEA